MSKAQKEPMALVPISKLVRIESNHGGYYGTECVVCKASGWEGKWEHKPECPALHPVDPKIVAMLSLKK